MAADYQQSMNKVQALTGSSTAQMQQYDSGLKALAVSAGVAPKALSDGLYNVISAGYAGASAMAVLTLATEDSKIGMTDAATTTTALTNIMANFKTGISGANVANGEMLQTVTMGKATFADYANTITKAASTSAQFGENMQTMNAAWATLTASGIKAGMATTDYDQSLQVMDGNIGKVSTSLQKNGIAFDESKFNAMDYGQKVVYLNAALQQARDKHVAITGATKQAAQAIKTIADHIKMYNDDLAKLNDKTAMAAKTQEAWAVTQGGFNQQMSRTQAAIQVLMIDIGSKLLPVLTSILGRITPLIGAFTTWATSGHAVSDMIATFHAHAQLLVPVLAGLGAVILSVLVPAVLSLAAGVIAATWPVIAIGAAVAGLVAIFMHFYSTSAPFKSFIDTLVSGFKQAAAVVTANFGPAMSQVGTFMRTYVLPALTAVGNFLRSTFTPVWDQLVATFRGEVMPAWNSLVSAIRPLLPELKMFAEFIAGVVVVVLLTLVAVIGGVIHAFASFLSGAIEVFSGVVQVISGAIKIVTGIISFFVDLVTFKWNKLGTDIGTVMDGIGTVIAGTWTAIKGVFQAGIGAVVGFVKGFLDTCVGIFHALSDTLVGHSIIPDMVNSIVTWFAGLPARAGAALSGLAGTLIGVIQSAGASAISAATSAGSSIVQGIAAGIEGAIGDVVGAIGDVAGAIAAHLPHSPAKVGPLVGLVDMGAQISKQLAQGMSQSVPTIKAAMQVMLQPIGPQGIHASMTSGVGVPMSAQQGITINVTVQGPTLDGQRMATSLMPYVVQSVRVNTGTRL